MRLMNHILEVKLHVLEQDLEHSTNWFFEMPQPDNQRPLPFRTPRKEKSFFLKRLKLEGY